MEQRDEPLAFGVVVEVGLEHVLDVEGVGGHDAMDLAGAAEDGGVGGAGGEDIGGPVEKAVAVLEESR